jgi:hypothetical protein
VVKLVGALNSKNSTGKDRGKKRNPDEQRIVERT